MPTGTAERIRTPTHEAQAAGDCWTGEEGHSTLRNPRLAFVSEGEHHMRNRFDELAKGLAGALTRRDALKCVGGFAGGSLLALLGLGNAATARGNRGGCKMRCRILAPTADGDG